MPAFIHSDQGREFDNLMHELCLLLEAHKPYTTPYHPASDGLVERFNRALLMMLAMFTVEHHDDWADLLPAVMMAYRSSIHQSTGFSPYRLMLVVSIACWAIGIQLQPDSPVLLIHCQDLFILRKLPDLEGWCPGCRPNRLTNRPTSAGASMVGVSTPGSAASSVSRLPLTRLCLGLRMFRLADGRFYHQ